MIMQKNLTKQTLNSYGKTIFKYNIRDYKLYENNESNKVKINKHLVELSKSGKQLFLIINN